MRIETAEKIVFSFAINAIVIASVFVGLFSYISKESGISKEEVDATIAVDDWLMRARESANGVTRPAGPIFLPPQPVQPSKTGENPAATNDNPATSNRYLDETGNVPPQERVAGIPWLRQEPGVTYMPLRSVPQILAQKYRSFDDVREVSQQGGGEFVDGRYRVTWIQPDSYLTTKLGLQSGDDVISVNGHPVGDSLSASKQMYDQLKEEKHFAVKVLRGGQPVVLSFAVN